MGQESLGLTSSRFISAISEGSMRKHMQGTLHNSLHRVTTQQVVLTITTEAEFMCLFKITQISSYHR